MGMFGFDKIQHFIASFAITIIDPWLAVLAGIIKEVSDELRGEMADVYDLLADGIGIVTALWLM